MNKLNRKLIAHTLNKDFELISLASIIALVSDLGWVIHDIMTNGMSIQYGLIGTGLLIGVVLSAIVFERRFLRDMLKYRKVLLKNAIKANKHV